jgi:NADH dehydrogenase/NADH:ubiquinone oxidoreductase subunit G
MIIPTLTNFEDDKIIVNLEQRPQKTKKIFNEFFDARSIKNIIGAFLIPTHKQVDIKSTFLNYFSEIISYPEKFEYFKTTYLSTKDYVYNVQFTKDIIKRYPLKSTIEDFYCSTKFTKNSFAMIQCSQYKRIYETNFLK